MHVFVDEMTFLSLRDYVKNEQILLLNYLQTNLFFVCYKRNTKYQSLFAATIFSRQVSDKNMS